MHARISLGSALALATVVLSSSLVSAATVVVPNAQTNALGNGQTARPFEVDGTPGSRYQQVYGADQFGGFTSLESITGLAFRAKQPLFVGNTVTVSNVTIRLSTTGRLATIDDANGISGDLNSNVGADVQTVYSGPLTLTTTTIGTVDSYYAFNLQTPFTYAKNAGNLLLDVIVPADATIVGSGGFGTSFSQFDTVTGDALGANSNDGVASAATAGPNDPIGANSTTGLVTRFTSMTVIPEPTSLAAAGLGAMLLRRRR
jgi:hypothetical protein